MASPARDIPDSVLDEAFRWAVVLNSGTTASAERSEFERWLQIPLHRSAWQRIEIIDQEFAAIRGNGGRGLRALDRAAAQRRNRKLKTLAGTLLVLPLVLLLSLPLLRQSIWQQLAPWHAQHVTARNEQKTIALAGGARVYLDGDTALDLQRVGATSILQLHRGRVMVDSSAAAAADKPQVTAGHGRFTPVGTRFIVTVDGSEVDLAVLQGRVRAESDSGEHVEAGAGERLHVTTLGIESSSDNGLLPGSWSEGVIEADNARLDEVLAALGRYRQGWLRCDPAVASLRVTGVFRLDDIEGALRSLERTLPVQATRTTEWWVSVQAQPR